MAGRPRVDLENASIGVGNPATWPNDVASLVNEVLEDICTWPEVEPGYPSCDLASHDYELSADIERRLRVAMNGRSIIAYHASRLLPHEIVAVQRDGLEVLSVDLIDRKHAAAREHYPELVSADEVKLLRTTAMHEVRSMGEHISLLWMVASFDLFRTQQGISGFWRLLSRWGGEAIYSTGKATEDELRAMAAIERLSAVSTPTIIELRIPVAVIPAWRELWPSFVGLVGGYEHPHTEWAVEIGVPADDLLDVIHPTDDRWPEEQTGL